MASDDDSKDRERRRHMRLPVERPVEIAWGGEKREVVLEDVSFSGAKVRLPRPPAVGTRLSITSGGKAIEATVARVSGLSVGIRFDHEDAAFEYVMGVVLKPPQDG